ncbi:MAG: hypothetical protein ACJ76N_15680 [Thermoanaerobaculia bacterium]
MELYKIAVEEYRFQVKLNAERSRDYLVLNSAIIAAAVSLSGQHATILAGVVFTAGLCVALLAGLGTHTQHNYYRETRDTKKLLERRLGISGSVVKTTPSTGSRRWRFGSVTRFNYIIIGMLCVVDLIGILVSLSVLPLPTRKPPKATQAPARISPAPTPSLSQQHPPQPTRPSPQPTAAQRSHPGRP